MFAKIATSVTGQFHDYRNAFASFGHNAKRFLISGFLQGLGGGILATVFGIFIKQAGMGESVVGGAEAALAAAAAVVSLLGTPLIAALGYRSMMVAALAVMVGSRIGMASYPLSGVIVGLSASVGLGDGFLRAIGSAFMSENSGKDERAHLFSIEFLVRVSAGLFGGLAGGFLPTFLSGHISELAAYQWTIVAGSLLIATGALPMFSMRESEREKTTVADAYRNSFSALKQWRRLLRLVAPQSAIALGGGMVIPFVPLYLKHSLGASIGEIGAVLGFSSVVTALGIFGMPVVSRKLGLARGVALTQGLSVPFLAAVSLATSLPAAVGALWIRGALMNMAGPMYNQLSMEGVEDAEKPVVAGWMFFGLNMMWLLGNLVGGRLMETSYVLPYVFAVALYATGATLTYLFWRSHDPRPSAEPAPTGASTREALPEAA